MSWDVGRFTPLGHGGSAIGTAGGTVTLPTGVHADRIKIVVLNIAGAAVRWRDDGTAPTASASSTAVTAGYPVAAGTDMRYEGMVEKLQVVATSGTAYVTWACYG